jgi:hypothetical protein
MRRLAVALAGCMIALAAPAHAAVTVGQSFVPTYDCTGAAGTALQTGIASGNSYTVPTPGVITSWSFHDGAATVPGLEFKVGRSVVGTTYQVVGTSPAGGQTPNAVGTYPARIPVHAGDVIGFYEAGGNCVSNTGNSADHYAGLMGIDAALYSSATYTNASSYLLPVTAAVEPDADGDGYGDETQDHCVGVSGGNNGCPVPATTPPPAPPDRTSPTVAALIGKSLKLSKGGAVSFFMTASENATGTATGTIGLPKGAKIIRLKAAKVKLAAGVSTRIALKLSKGNLKAARKALAHHKLRAKITVTVSDAAGNRRVKLLAPRLG